MARILFFISSILFISSISAAASSKMVNLRYAGSPLVEVGLGRFGLGLGSNSLSTSSTDADGYYSVNGSSTTAKLTLYSSGMGSDSWYAAATGSLMKIKVDRTLTGVDYNATGTGTYSSFTVGYHWFWNVFNLNLGFGSSSLALNKIDIKDSSDNTINTIAGSKFNLPAMDLGFGLAF